MPHSDGINMMPVVRHGDRGWTRPIVSEARINNPYYLRRTGKHGFNSELDVRGLRLGRWKLSLYAGGDMELYDLARDPLEMRSLQDDPKHARIRREMMRLWWKYKDCAGAQCAAPLPPHLRLTPAQEKRLTDEMYRRMSSYFSDPAWLTALGR
jgi:arylsulfatase A-like enzyme